MKLTLEKWQKLLCFVKSQYPIIIDERGLTVFPAVQDGVTARKILALSARNMVAYWFYQLLAIYPTLDHMKSSSSIAPYLQTVFHFLSRNNNQVLFYRDSFSAHITVEDENALLEEIQHFPQNSTACDERIQCIHSFIEKLAKTSKLPEESQWKELYHLNSSWQKEMIQPQFRLLPDSEVIRIVSNHIRHQFTRVGINHHRNLAWGKEFDQYLTEFTAQGNSPNHAKWLARKKFMSAHPAPLTEQELLEQEAYPGLTQKCLQRYRNIYLASLKNE